MISQQQINTIIQILKPYKPMQIGIFGSYARNEETSKSDLDILAQFERGFTLFDLVDAEDKLKEKLNVQVDLVISGAIKNERLKSYINKDLKIIYG